MRFAVTLISFWTRESEKVCDNRTVHL